LSFDSSEQNSPRWTLPPRRKISPDDLHISSFVIVKKRMMGQRTEESERQFILLLRAGDRHPLSFRRGKLLLPATILSYGEQPRAAARRVLKEQVGNAESLEDPQFLKLQSYLGAHWDIVILFQAWFDGQDLQIQPKEPFVQGTFYDINALPRAEIAEDHLEVIDSMLNPSDDATV
jgi:ADP-ribose pyrophosphatase YjhB (NUDIX family)